MGMAAAGIGASIAGGKVGQMMEGSGKQNSTPDFVNQMNNMLTQARDNAISTSTNYMNKGVDQQNQSLGTATNALNTSLTNANQAATSNINNGLAQSIAMQAPAASAGYGALDAYQDSLGLSRVGVGSQALAQALQGQAAMQPLFQSVQQAGQTAGVKDAYAGMGAGNMGVAPTAPNLGQITGAITPGQVENYFNSNLSWDGPHQRENSAATGNRLLDQQGWSDNPSIMNPMRDQIRTYLAKQQYDTANTAYQGQLGTYNNNNSAYGAAYNQANQALNTFNPQQQQIALAYQNGLFNKGGQ